MKPTIRFITLFIIVIQIASACNSSPPAPTATHTLAVSPTETTAPTETATPEPSLTPTPAVLGLEIVEWSEWPYASPADPSNTDTHVEVLIRNPNDFPVRVNNDEDELRFINAAGEVVFTNPSSFFYLWQGEWMLPGETTALSACVCFWTSGLEKQDWESLELVAPLEIATDIAYTPDVKVMLGEFFNLADAHLGGSRYVGVAMFGNAVVSFTENISIQPGDTATGVVVSDIDYIDMNVPLSYEVAAIGILAQAAAATEDVTLPSGTPMVEWEGIPIMPGAISGEATNDGYQFTTQADLDEIMRFYETALTNLGFEFELTVDETAGYAILAFHKGDATGIVAIAPVGGLHGVLITISA